MRDESRNVSWLDSLDRNVLALAWLGLAALALPVGCENGEAPTADAEYSVSPPAHPALRETASSAGQGGAVNPHGGAVGGALPPGHPPVTKETATTSTSAEEPKSDFAERLKRFGVRAVTPAGWAEIPTTSSMRLATFRLSGDDGDAEMSVIPLPASQTEEANITRWRGQFEENPEATTATKEASGVKITVAEMEGTFTGAGQPEPNSRLWGAIIRVPGASQLLFFKAWGPKATMESWNESFREFVDSVGPVE